MDYHKIELRIPKVRWHAVSSRWLPTPGNVLFTVVLIAALIWLQSAGIVSLFAQSSNGLSVGTIPYQGRLADANGAPVTGTYGMTFRLYATPVGGVPLWEEFWTGSNSVAVSDGLFNIMLGSLNPVAQNLITGNNSLFLGISVGSDDEMTPRVQLGSVPYAIQALTVPDASITAAKLADGAVTQNKLGPDISLIPPDGSIGAAQLATDSVLSANITDGTIASADLAANAVQSRHMQPTMQSLYKTDRQQTSSTGWVDIPGTTVTLSVDTEQNILVWGQASVFQAGTDGYPGVRLVANGVELAVASSNGGGAPGGAWSYETVPVMGVYAATPGQVTIKMQFRSGASYGTVYATNRNLFGLATGR